MTWRFRPEPHLVLTVQRSGTATAIPLTPYVLDWDVTYGTSFDEGSGRWVMQTATGSITLDNAGHHFEADNSEAIITTADTVIPQPVTISLGDGGETLWSGLAIVRAAERLRGDATVTWDLVGRYWQVWRRLLEWEQVSDLDDGLGGEELCRRVLRDALGKDASFNGLSPASVWPDDLLLRNVRITETGGSAWNRLALALGAIPFEDHLGRPGMAAMHKADEGRQIDVPATAYALDHSELATVPTAALWTIDVTGRRYSLDRRNSNLVTTDEAGFTRTVVVRYDFPDDVIGVDWRTPQPTANAGWSLVAWQAYPAPDRTRADIVRALIRKDNDQAQPSGVKFVGKKLTANGEPLVVSVGVDIPGAGLLDERAQATAPWVHVTDSGFRTTAHAALAEQINQAKVRGDLSYPLWAPLLTSRLPTNVSDRTGMLVPGSVSRYPIEPNRVSDLITGTVTLRGAASDVPYADIVGWTYLGAGDDTEPIIPGIPIPTEYPLPFDIPPDIAPVPTPDKPPAPEISGGGGLELFASTSQTRYGDVLKLDFENDTSESVADISSIPFANHLEEGGNASITELDGKLYVMYYKSLFVRQVAQVDPNTKATTLVTPDSGNIFLSGVTAHDGNLYVINWAVFPTTVMRVDIANSELVGLGSANTGVSDIASLASTGTAFYIASNSRGIGVVDLSDGSVRWTLPAATGGPRLYGIGGRLYAVFDSNVSRVNLQTGAYESVYTDANATFSGVAGTQDELYVCTRFVGAAGGGDVRKLTLDDAGDVSQTETALTITTGGFRAGYYDIVGVGSSSGGGDAGALPKLASLSVIGFQLTPEFEADIGTYTVFVASAYAGDIRVTASVSGTDTITMVDANSERAVPRGKIGTWSISAGASATLKVRVTSDAGSAAVYSINVARV